MEERISENNLILPALYFMEKEPGITISKLKPFLIELFNPVGKDAEIAKNRKDTYFEQKVRNLVSHRTLDKLGYANYISKDQDQEGILTITELGKSFLHENIDTIEYVFNGSFKYDDIKNSFATITKVNEKNKKIILYDEEILIEEGTKKIKNSEVYERSRKLRNIAIEYYTINERIKCIACSFDFYDTYGEIGKGYIEVHHQKPIFRYEDQDFAIFIKQALQNVVPVCPNCHRMIHRKKNTPLSIEELKMLLKKPS